MRRKYTHFFSSRRKKQTEKNAVPLFFVSMPQLTDQQHAGVGMALQLRDARPSLWQTFGCRSRYRGLFPYDYQTIDNYFFDNWRLLFIFAAWLQHFAEKIYNR
jgi:hypothetical protein